AVAATGQSKTSKNARGRIMASTNGAAAAKSDGWRVSHRILDRPRVCNVPHEMACIPCASFAHTHRPPPPRVHAIVKMTCISFASFTHPHGETPLATAKPNPAPPERLGKTSWLWDNRCGQIR